MLPEMDCGTEVLNLGGGSDHRRKETVKLEGTCAKYKLQKFCSLVWGCPGLVLK